MHLTINKRYPLSIQMDMTSLMNFAFLNSPHDDVEVHIKQHGKGAYYQGVCYYLWGRYQLQPDPRPIRMVRLQRPIAETRYLITMRIPTPDNLTAMPVPFTVHYTKYKTAPPFTVYSWQERFLHLAAHEAFHAYNDRYRYKQSEIGCEMQAIGVVVAYRRLIEDASKIYNTLQHAARTIA